MSKKRVLPEQVEDGVDGAQALTAIRKSAVPKYLQDSEFYRSLQDDDDCISVPSNCCKTKYAIESNTELHYHLSTVRFWVANPLTDAFLTYVLTQSFATYGRVLAPFYRDLPVLRHIQAIADARPSDRMMAAIEAGVVDIVKYINKKGAPWPHDVCATIARLGNLELLKLAHESSCDLSPRALINAAGGGHLDCMRYLRENGCAWADIISRATVRGDHLDCLKYAHENGCPWDASTFDRYTDEGDEDGIYYNLCTLAAEAGGLQCLRYAHSHGVPLLPALYFEAAGSKNIDCFRYAYEQGCRFPLDAYDAAIVHNNIPLIEFLHECGHPFEAGHCEIAVAHNYMDTLRWLHEHGCPWEEGACDIAVEDNNLEAVLYLLRHGCPPSGNLFAWEDESQLMQVLKCFVELLLPWDDVPACTGLAARNGFFEAVKYMVENGCPWEDCTTSCAAQTGRLNILTYAHERGCSWAEDTCLVAAFGGHLDCLKYAHTHGCAIPVIMCAELLEITLFDLECFKYAHQHGSELKEGFVQIAEEWGRWELVAYLKEHGCQ